MAVNMTISAFIGTSLDGYIARENGDLDWLDKANELVPVGEDCGYAAFMSSVDVLIMGRKTYEKVLSFGSWSYGATKVIVLSRSKVEIPSELEETVSYSSETPVALCERLQNEGNKYLYIDGGMTIQSFLAEQLLTDITITRVPVILGSGIPLFGRLDDDIHLNHLGSIVYDFGFVQSKYEVRKLRN